MSQHGKYLDQTFLHMFVKMMHKCVYTLCSLAKLWKSSKLKCDMIVFKYLAVNPGLSAQDTDALHFHLSYNVYD